MLDDSVREQVLAATEKAEDFFDSLVISGPSKTETTERGQPKTITVPLLNQRLHVPADLPRSPDGGSLPEQRAVFRELDVARRAFQGDGTLEKAVEARILLDQQG